MWIYFVSFLISTSKRKLSLTFEYSFLVERAHKHAPFLATWSQQLKWKKFHKQYPNLQEHTKPYRKPSDLVSKLVSEGVDIPDSVVAEKIIYSHNYFRLKAYFIPFMNDDGTFKPNTNFNNIYALYLADQKIRDFLFPLIALLEVQMRSVLDNEITSSTNDPFWHLNPSNFISYAEIKVVLDKAGQRFKASQQEFVKHHRDKYYTSKPFDFKQIPPFWVISETFTLEQLQTVANKIDSDKFALSGSNKIDAFANQFGLNSYKAFTTNLKCIRDLRNICAHHSRLWNSNLAAPNSVTKHLKFKSQEKKNNRLYNNIVMLRIMCKSRDIDDGLKDFFINLIASNPILQEQKQSMGFPTNWEEDPFWDKLSAHETNVLQHLINNCEEYIIEHAKQNGIKKTDTSIRVAKFLVAHPDNLTKMNDSQKFHYKTAIEPLIRNVPCDRKINEDGSCLGNGFIDNDSLLDAYLEQDMHCKHCKATTNS